MKLTDIGLKIGPRFVGTRRDPHCKGTRHIFKGEANGDHIKGYTKEIKASRLHG